MYLNTMAITAPHVSSCMYDLIVSPNATLTVNDLVLLFTPTTIATNLPPWLAQSACRSQTQA